MKDVDSGTRGHGTSRAVGPLPGIFRPARPKDTQQVVLLFAVAARAACADPTALTAIGQTLAALCSRLVPPESHAARECAKLWSLFSRVAQVPKEALRREAGRALCRDLDALGQRLELPPLPEWPQLPEGIEEKDAVEAMVGEEPTAAGTSTLAHIQDRARELSAASRLTAPEMVRLLGALEREALRELLDRTVGAGLLNRSDVSLLVRFLVKGEAIGPADTILVEALARLGSYLASTKP